MSDTERGRERAEGLIRLASNALDEAIPIDENLASQPRPQAESQRPAQQQQQPPEGE